MSFCRRLFRAVLLTWILLDNVNCGFYNKDDAAKEKDPKILLQKWEQMEESMLKGVNSMVKNIMPILTNPPEGLVISESCNDALLQTISDLTELKRWALKLLDATGKPMGGQLRGSLAALGSYDECLDIRVQDAPDLDDVMFQGQYCLVDFRPILPEKDKPYYYLGEIMTVFQNFTPKTEYMQDFVKLTPSFYDSAFRIGICLPSLCSSQDLGSILASVLNNTNWASIINSCEVDKPIEIRNDMWIALGVIASYLLVVLVSTFYDYYTYPRQAETPEILSSGQRLLLAFSFRRAVRKTVAPRTLQNPHLYALNGIRFLTITWVLLGHTYLFSDTYDFRELLNMFTVVKQIEMQVILNGFLSVDSFFFVTGLLTSYQILKVTKSHGKRAFNIPLILARRVWKFLPISMLLVGIIIWMPTMGSGPMWNYLMEPFSETCRQNWWKLALFVNNFNTADTMCANHTWYLSVDVQFLIIALIYIWIYFKNEKLGFAFLGLLVTFSVVSTGVVTYVFDDTPIQVFSQVDHRYLVIMAKRGYYAPSVHLGVFAMGLALGTFLSKDIKLQLSKTTKVVGWMIATILALTALYGSVIWNNGIRTSPIYAAIYSSFTKNGFGLGLVWLCLVCTTGNGGIVNKILSWDGFTILNRITFMMYLFHVPIMTYYTAGLKGNIDLSKVTMTWLFLGHLSIAIIVAVFARLLFESPLNELDMIIFNHKLASNKLKKSGNTIIMDNVSFKNTKQKSPVNNGHVNDVENNSENVKSELEQNEVHKNDELQCKA